jgi:hypothetical protein
MTYKKRSPQIGDAITLKSRYSDTFNHAIIIDVHKAENFGECGWISFTYEILTNSDQIMYISESCIDKIINKKREI